MRVRDERRPELALEPRHAVDKEVGRVGNDHGHWASGLVGTIAVLIVPCLAVAEEDTTAVTIEGHVSAAEEPSCRSDHGSVYTDMW